MRLLSLPACLKLNPAPFASCSMNQDITAEGATQSSGQQQSLGGSPASEQSSLQRKWRLFKVSNPMPCSAKFPPPPPQRSLHNLRPHILHCQSPGLSPGCNPGPFTPAFVFINTLRSAPHTRIPALPWVFLSAGNSFPGSAGPGHLSERFPPTRPEELATPRALPWPFHFLPPTVFLLKMSFHAWSFFHLSAFCLPASHQPACQLYQNRNLPVLPTARPLSVTKTESLVGGQ